MSVKDLIQTIQSEVQQRQQSVPPDNISSSSGFTLISDAKAYLNNAEFRAQSRMKWPDKLNRFPFNLSQRFQRGILKGVRFLFRDQQEVNLNLINAQRQSLEMQQQLLAEISALKMECRAQRAEILALRTVDASTQIKE